MNWELIKVKQTDWVQDNSGYYTLINWIDDNTVRLDVMGIADSLNPTDYPVVSFQGTASDIRKYIMQWFSKGIGQIDGRLYQSVFSIEHAAYIGSELARCELMQGLYVQD